DLQHHILNRGIVTEVRREHALPRASHPSRSAAEVEEQIGEGRTRREDGLLHAHPAGTRRRLDALRGYIAIERGEPLTPRRAVRGGRCLRVGPRKASLGIVPEPEVHHLGECEPMARAGGVRGNGGLGGGTGAVIVLRSLGGGVQGFSGAGDAPGIPDTLGVLTQPTTSAPTRGRTKPEYDLITVCHPILRPQV